MNTFNRDRVDQYVVGIYADLKGVGITLIGTNKEIDTFWVFKYIYHHQGTILSIKRSLNSLFEKFPQIRKIHVNNMENLRRQLNADYKKKLFVEHKNKPGVCLFRNTL